MSVALITGCSSGFGLLAAIELSRAGFQVFAGLRSLSRRQRIDDAAAAAKVKLEVMKLDVLDPGDLVRAVAVVEAMGGLEVLVNNAGFGLAGFVHDLTIEEYREQFDTNFFAAVALTKAVLPAMIKRRHGRIINISSTNGRVAVPGLSAYCASKFALEGFTESLRYELAPFGMWASLIEPGTFKTDIFDRNRREGSRIRDTSSPYAEMTRRMESVVEKRLAKSTADPRLVAKMIHIAATAKRPRLRYVVGRDAKLEVGAKGLLPTALFESLVLGETGLKRGSRGAL